MNPLSFVSTETLESVEAGGLRRIKDGNMTPAERDQVLSTVAKVGLVLASRQLAHIQEHAPLNVPPDVPDHL